MKKLTYPVRVTYFYGTTTYTVVDFPDITLSFPGSSRADSLVFSILYDRIDGALHALVHHGLKFPTPTYVVPSEQEDYIYITIPFQRKEFYWNKPFLDCCISASIVSAFIALFTNKSFLGALLVWSISWLSIFIESILVSACTHHLQETFSFEKVSLSKRLLAILGLSVLSAMAIFLWYQFKPTDAS